MERATWAEINDEPGPPPMHPTTEPAPPPYTAPPAGAEQLAVGAAFSCLLRQGSVRCWGSNRFGQLGASSLDTGRGAFSARPVEVEGLDDVRAIALGSFHACALLGGGGVRCWGHGGYGQLGDGGQQDAGTPRAVSGLSRVQALACGEHHSCAIRDSEVLCWGSNAREQLGQSSGSESLTPQLVHDLSRDAIAARNVGRPLALGAGRAHTCVLLSGGSVECWGEDVDGQLGRGALDLPAGASHSVAAVAGPPSVSTLRVGWGHGCGITYERTAWCWGRNDANQIGDAGGGAQASRAAQAVALDLADVVDVAPGAFHSCVLLEGSDASCVGANHNGQLGDGGHRPHARFVPVAGIHHAVSIAAGESHSCALLRSGEVRCWGNPHSGRVGPHADERARRQPTSVRVIAARATASAP